MPRWGRLIWLTGLLACCGWTADAWAHPDIHEVGLLSHFAPGVHAIRNGALADLNHALIAQVEGTTYVDTVGPTEAFVLDGKSAWLTLASSPADAADALPRRALTVAAWVLVNDASQQAGVAGLFHDTQASQEGWLLGCRDGKFCFGLSAAGTAKQPGDQQRTWITSQTPIAPHRWYYLVATYDGAQMKLYLNGNCQAESQAEAGDIVYPEQAPYTLGAWVDGPTRAPLEGAIFEVKTYDRALAADEIEAVALKNANLVNFAPEDEALSFLVPPYLQFGTQTSMVVMAETNRPTKLRVEYGENPPLAQAAEAAESRLIGEVQLTGLKPHTSYFYRVTATDEAGAQVVSPMFSLQTAPPPEMPWAFTVIGDTQRNPQVTKKCAEGAYALRPNFLLHCGDTVDNGHAKNQWIGDLLVPISTLSSRVPMFPVIGNHEQNSHWYYDYFSLPAPEYYYTFHYGNSQFFMIDSNKPLDPDSEQYQWLERELASSKATWKFTCHHHPCFSSDENDYGDHVKGEEGEGPEVYTWGDPNARKLTPLYEKYGVDIAWNGHIHLYERTWPIYQMTINQEKGVRYITSGGGGGHLEQAAPQRSWFSLHFKRAYHYCYVTIHDRSIQLKAYDIDGQLFDTFELTKPPGR